MYGMVAAECLDPWAPLGSFGARGCLSPPASLGLVLIPTFARCGSMPAAWPARYIVFQMAEFAIPRQNVPGEFLVDRGAATQPPPASEFARPSPASKGSNGRILCANARENGACAAVRGAGDDSCDATRLPCQKAGNAQKFSRFQESSRESRGYLKHDQILGPHSCVHFRKRSTGRRAAIVVSRSVIGPRGLCKGKGCRGLHGGV